MFGYTIMYPRFETWKMHRCYKNYYCGTCFGLEHNYGQACRMLLSYDVTLIALILGCHSSPLQKKFKCFGQCRQKKCIFYEGMWNQIAAINILLVNEKLKDDINDENSIIARIGKLILNRKIRKAKRSFPKMAAAISKGYENMYILEKRGSGIREIEDCFATMMVNTLEECKRLTEWERKYIVCVARWIYYIDALDDYEKDFKEGKFNALKKSDAKNLYEYTRKYISVIASDLNYIYKDIRELINTAGNEEDTMDMKADTDIMDMKADADITDIKDITNIRRTMDDKDITIERKILLTLIKDNMAFTTAKVITQNEGIKIKVGSIWDGRRK